MQPQRIPSIHTDIRMYVCSLLITSLLPHYNLAALLDLVLRQIMKIPAKAFLVQTGTHTRTHAHTYVYPHVVAATTVVVLL